MIERRIDARRLQRNRFDRTAIVGEPAAAGHRIDFGEHVPDGDRAVADHVAAAVVAARYLAAAVAQHDRVRQDRSARQGKYATGTGRGIARHRRVRQGRQRNRHTEGRDDTAATGAGRIARNGRIDQCQTGGVRDSATVERGIARYGRGDEFDGTFDAESTAGGERVIAGNGAVCDRKHRTRFHKNPAPVVRVSAGKRQAFDVRCPAADEKHPAGCIVHPGCGIRIERHVGPVVAVDIAVDGHIGCDLELPVAAEIDRPAVRENSPVKGDRIVAFAVAVGVVHLVGEGQRFTETGLVVERVHDVIRDGDNERSRFRQGLDLDGARIDRAAMVDVIAERVPPDPRHAHCRGHRAAAIRRYLRRRRHR